MTAWLIDAENVGDSFVGLVDPARDFVIMVYTMGHRPKSVPDLECLSEFESIAGPQSVNLAISALLGGMLVKHPGDEYVIVSNERDFKPLCLTMVANGYHVKQVSCCYEISRSNPAKSSFSKAVGCGGAVLGPVMQESAVEKVEPAVPVRSLDEAASERPRGFSVLRTLLSTLRTSRR